MACSHRVPCGALILPPGYHQRPGDRVSRRPAGQSSPAGTGDRSPGSSTGAQFLVGCSGTSAGAAFNRIPYCSDRLPGGVPKFSGTRERWSRRFRSAWISGCDTSAERCHSRVECEVAGRPEQVSHLQYQPNSPPDSGEANSDWNGTTWVGGLARRLQSVSPFVLYPTKKAKLTRARCYVAAQGYHETFLNGAFANAQEEVLGPAMHFNPHSVRRFRLWVAAQRRGRQCCLPPPRTRMVGTA